jgi:hypothetical protein
VSWESKRWVLSHKAHALTDKEADFMKTSGDTVFDSTLRQGLSVQLEQSPFLRIISDQQIQQTYLQLKSRSRMRRSRRSLPANSECVRSRWLDSADWHAVPSDPEGGHLGKRGIAGELGSTGERQEPCAQCSGKGSLGNSKQTGRVAWHCTEFDTPFEQASTPSLEALKALSSGRKVAGASGPVAAVPFFKRAIELDKNFALATSES